MNVIWQQEGRNEISIQVVAGGGANGPGGGDGVRLRLRLWLRQLIGGRGGRAHFI
jgi:hypothetical protein